jgi:hypothetical protein
MVGRYHNMEMMEFGVDDDDDDLLSLTTTEL